MIWQVWKLYLKKNKNEIAGVIVEPVAANMGIVLAQNGFLEGLRSLCDKNHALLIFDEVITGFRLGLGGASEYYKIKPDLITYGKIIGAGMPVGAYGGRRDVMSVVAPLGAVYQAGTLSGNPLAMRAGITQLTMLKENPSIYTKMNQLGNKFRDGVRKILAKYELPYQITGLESLSCLYFEKEPVVDYASAKKSDTKLFADYFKYMLAQGNYFGPSQFEAIFLSAEHTDEMIEKTLEDMDAYFSK